MIFKLAISFLLLFSSQQLIAQIDTLAIHHNLLALSTPKSHANFWKDIYTMDQSFRGDQTNDSVDMVNLVKSAMYYNKYGYPTPSKSGKESSIIQYVWIHNNVPRNNELTFPMIFQGYLAKQLTEDNLRNYLIRSIYNLKFNDKGYSTKPIKTILKQLDLNISGKINIDAILTEYELEQNFLKSKRTTIGIWKNETTYDTLYHQGNPIKVESEGEQIKMMQDSMGIYYIQDITEGGGNRPRLLKKVKLGKFKLFENPNEYYEVLNNKDLKIYRNKGSRIIKFYSESE